MTMQGPIEERMTIGYGPLPTPDDLPQEEQVGSMYIYLYF
jgi:hypothetical protein